MHNLLSDSFEAFNVRSYQTDKEVTFHMLFNNLEEFLTQLTQEKSGEYTNSKAMEPGEDNILAKAKAKEYFTNSAHEIILTIRKQLECDGIFHYIPMSHLDRIISDTKQELIKNYEKIFESINNKQNSPGADSAGADSTESKQDKDINESVDPVRKKGKKGKNKIPKRALLILKNWLTEHFNDPYPSSQEKIRLAKETGITLKQVQNWFTNARGRIWRKTCNPEKFSSMIEEKLKGHDGKAEA